MHWVVASTGTFVSTTSRRFCRTSLLLCAQPRDCSVVGFRVYGLRKLTWKFLLCLDRTIIISNYVVFSRSRVASSLTVIGDFSCRDYFSTSWILERVFGVIFAEAPWRFPLIILSPYSPLHTVLLLSLLSLCRVLNGFRRCFRSFSCACFQLGIRSLSSKRFGSLIVSFLFCSTKLRLEFVTLLELSRNLIQFRTELCSIPHV